MAVELYASDNFAPPGGQAQDASNRVRATLHYCRFRCVTSVAGDEGSTFRLCVLPQHGRYLSQLSKCGWKGFGLGCVLALGWEAYTLPSGLVVPASAAGLGSGLDVAADGRAFLDQLDASVDECAAPVDIVLTATISGGPVPADASWGGVIVYAFAH